eukprot:2051-Heterococcus_DN1.PRE.2
MVTTRRQKQAACTPLRDAGVLQRIFAFLPGNYLFIGAVCREWQAVYTSMRDQKVRCVDIEGYERPWKTCSSTTTVYSAVIASPAAVRLACRSGLDLKDESGNLQLCTGLQADLCTVAELCKQGMTLTAVLVNATALSGRLHILQYLFLQQHCSIPSDLSEYAVRSSSISMLTWLKTQTSCTFDMMTCAAAAFGNQFAVLQHLRNEGCEWDNKRIGQCTAVSGNIAMLDWVRQQQGVEITAITLLMAALSGETAMCAHLRSIGCDWPVHACNYAAVRGHIETLHWLRQNGCPCNIADVCSAAARYGSTSILNYVNEQWEVMSAELLTKSLLQAGVYNQLETVQWLRQHGAQWPAVLSKGQGAKLIVWREDVLTWAKAQGCTAPITV